MSDYAPRRALGDVIGEFADMAMALQHGASAMTGLKTESIELSLPIEAMLSHRGGALVFIADVPRFRSRSDFDVPASRIAFRLEAETTR